MNHFAYLFVREALVLFPEALERDNKQFTLDFEAINSCNWNDVRLKFPFNYKENVGFLIEFRPMEMCITNKEKSAHVAFIRMM